MKFVKIVNQFKPSNMEDYKHLEKYIEVTERQYIAFMSRGIAWRTIDDKLICSNEIMAEVGIIVQYMYTIRLNGVKVLTTLKQADAVEYTKQYVINNLHNKK